MKFENTQFDDMCFIDESSWLIRWSYIWMGFTQRLMRVTPIMPPVVYKGFKGSLKGVYIDDLAKALGITDPQACIIIGLHKRRLRQRTIAFLSLYFTLVLPFAFAPLIYFLNIETAFESTFVELFETFGLTEILAFVVFSFVYPPAIVKLGATVVDKHYADSLCVLTSFFVACEMTRDDVLLYPERRRSLLHRIDTLARLTRLLSVKFPGGCESTRAWSWEHFKNLEMYVRGHEREVIAPTKNTISNLREKMAELIELYIFGQYGNDVWKGSTLNLSLAQETEVSRRVSYIQRILGPMIPGALLIVMGLFPDFINFLGIEKNTLFLIVVTWLIIALDASLGLGVIEKVVKTAKEIRELK